MLVTHEPDVAQYAKRIVEVRDGHIVRDHPVLGRRSAADDLRELDAEPRRAIAGARGGRMKQSTLLKVASTSILKNKMRTLLTMLGIVIGVGAVIVMVAIGNGAQTQITTQISSLGTNLIIIMPGAGTPGGVNQGAGTFNKLTVADADKLKREGTLFNAVSPVVSARTQVIAGGATGARASTACRPTIRPFAIGRRAPARSSATTTCTSARKVAVLGATVVKNLFPDADPVGAQIQIGKAPFTVVGVMARRVRTPAARIRTTSCSFRTRRRRTRLSGNVRIGQILVSTDVGRRHGRGAARSDDDHARRASISTAPTTISPSAIRPRSPRR